MLVVLIICCLLQTLRAAPLPPDIIANGAVRQSPAIPEQQYRTTYVIVQSCLLTVFACVWKSAHPNINGPMDSGWTSMKRKVATVLCTLIAPEVVIFWALCQHSAAKDIAAQYNEEFATSGDMHKSFWREVLDWFQPLPKETTRRSSGQAWTKTHGFFIQMGGFILYENNYPKEVLNYHRFSYLLRHEAIDAPTVTERDLQDRSKGDAVSKAIVVLQTMWFIFQCSVRTEERLQLSELEVLTLAFALVNATIYAVWWDKPQEVDMAICVPLKTVDTTPAMAGVQTSEPLHSPHPVSMHHQEDDDSPLTPLHEPRGHQAQERRTWIGRKVRKDRKDFTAFVFLLFRLPYRLVASVMRPFDKMGERIQFDERNLRVPVFYSDASDENRSQSFSTSCMIGTIFGAVHLLAWGSKFPSQTELALWRISAIVVTMAPLMLLFAALILDTIFVLLALLYITARFVLIAVALRAIWSPSPEVLLDINATWTSYLPHV